MLDRTHPKIQMLFALLALPLIAGFDLAESERPIEFTQAPALQDDRRADQSEIEFHRSLAKAYFDLAAQHANSAQDRQIFVQKALSAGNGETPEPAHLEEWVLSDEQRVILSEARSHLVTHLTTTSDPVSKTAALTNFDCWVARAEQAIFASDHQLCRQAFEHAVGLAPRDLQPAHTAAQRPEEAKKTSS